MRVLYTPKAPRGKTARPDDERRVEKARPFDRADSTLGMRALRGWRRPAQRYGDLVKSRRELGIRRLLVGRDRLQ